MGGVVYSRNVGPEGAQRRQVRRVSKGGGGRVSKTNALAEFVSRKVEAGKFYSVFSLNVKINLCISSYLRISSTEISQPRNERCRPPSRKTSGHPGPRRLAPLLFKHTRNAAIVARPATSIANSTSHTNARCPAFLLANGFSSIIAIPNPSNIHEGSTLGRQPFGRVVDNALARGALCAAATLRRHD